MARDHLDFTIDSIIFDAAPLCARQLPAKARSHKRGSRSYIALLRRSCKFRRPPTVEASGSSDALSAGVPLDFHIPTASSSSSVSPVSHKHDNSNSKSSSNSQSHEVSGTQNINSDIVFQTNDNSHSDINCASISASQIQILTGVSQSHIQDITGASQLHAVAHADNNYILSGISSSSTSTPHVHSSISPQVSFQSVSHSFVNSISHSSGVASSIEEEIISSVSPAQLDHVVIFPQLQDSTLHFSTPQASHVPSQAPPEQVAPGLAGSMFVC